MQHLVSIIMPAYNAEKYIAESIRSVLDQTFQDWELIVVDDGSEDKTAEVVRGFSSADDRIKYVYQQNGGQGKARNTGIKASQGDLIAFLDSDDLWIREKLALQIEMIEETKADVVFSDAFMFAEDDVTSEERSFASVYGKFNGAGRRDGPGMYRLLLEMNPIPILSVLMRRDILESVGLFEEDLRYKSCEDYELWFRVAAHGAVFYSCEEKLARYRVHANAISRKTDKIYKAEVAVLERYQPGEGRDYDRLKERIKATYRLIISTLMKDNRLVEARECLKELSAWDRSGAVTLLQKGLMRAVPGSYNSVSEQLYRAERFLSHIKSIRGRRTIARLRKLRTKFSQQ